MLKIAEKESVINFEFEPDSFVYGAYYHIVSTKNGKYIDGKSSNHDLYLNYPNEGAFQRWRLQKNSIENNIQTYWIIHKESGMAIDGAGEQNSDAYIHSKNDGPYQKWYIEPVYEKGNDGKDILTTEVRIYHIVDIDGDNEKSYLRSPDTINENITLVEFNEEDPFLKWNFSIIYSIPLPVDNPRTEFQDFEPGGNLKKIIQTSDKVNDTDAPSVLHFTTNYDKSTAVTFSYSETLMLGMSTTFTAEAPGLSASQSFTVELTLSASQSKTDTITLNYSVVEDVTAPPRSRIVFTSTLTLADGGIVPFETTVRTKGVVDALNNGYLKLTYEQFANELRRSGADCTITDQSDGFATVTLKGSMSGNFLSNYDSNTNQYPLD